MIMHGRISVLKEIAPIVYTAALGMITNNTMSKTVGSDGLGKWLFIVIVFSDTLIKCLFTITNSMNIFSAFYSQSMSGSTHHRLMYEADMMVRKQGMVAKKAAELLRYYSVPLPDVKVAESTIITK